MLRFSQTLSNIAKTLNCYRLFDELFKYFLLIMNIYAILKRFTKRTNYFMYWNKNETYLNEIYPLTNKLKIQPRKYAKSRMKSPLPSLRH